MKLSFGHASGNRALQLSIALALVFASTSLAEIEGSTYTYAAAGSGGTVLTGSANATYTDPSNPGFCVGPPNDCQSGGMSSGFSFSPTGPTGDQIIFSFAGSSAPSSGGGFTIDLSNFATTDGTTILGLALDPSSGSLQEGSFTGSWDSVTGDATFTGSSASGFSAIGGASVTFDITESPEPASLLLSGLGLAGLAIAGIRRKRNA